MIDTPVALAAERLATPTTRDPALLVAQVTTLWLESAALHAETAILHEHSRAWMAGRGRGPVAPTAVACHHAGARSTSTSGRRGCAFTQTEGGPRM